MAKILIITIQVKLCFLILASLGIGTKFTYIVIIKFFPSIFYQIPFQGPSVRFISHTLHGPVTFATCSHVF